MEATMGETGEGSKEGAALCKPGDVRVNGEMNGSFEDMEVCENSPHNSIVSKMAVSDPLADDNSGDNVLLDDVSNCSNDFNNKDCSLSDKEETKVPSEKSVIENDLGTEVPDAKESLANNQGEDVHDERKEEDPVQEEEDEEDEEREDEEQEDEEQEGELERDEDAEQEHAEQIEQQQQEGEEHTNMEVDEKNSDSVDGAEGNNSAVDVDTRNSSSFTHNDVDSDTKSDTLDAPEVDPLGESERKEEEEGDKGLNIAEKSCVESERNECSAKENSEEDNAVKEKSAEKEDTKSLKGDDAPKSEIKENENRDKEEKKEDESEPKPGESPGKVKKPRKSVPVVNLPPRRSSRNLSKTQKSYVEKEDEPEIEEITPEDPLADPLSTDPFREEKDNTKTRNTRKPAAIVVNDTKRLVEIAAGTKNMKGGKKEPTLVIIDTNSILSGRGPVPVSQTPPPPVTASPSSSGFSVLPVAVPAQGMYPAHAQPQTHLLSSHPSLRITAAPPPPPKPPQILPTLTDDMYVVEAPSFIVPYVYEKPPLNPLKEYIDKIGKQLEEQREKERKEKEEKEKIRKEKEEKERKEKEIEIKEKEEQERKEKEEKERKEKEEQERKEKEEGEKVAEPSEEQDGKKDDKVGESVEKDAECEAKKNETDDTGKSIEEKPKTNETEEQRTENSKAKDNVANSGEAKSAPATPQTATPEVKEKGTEARPDEKQNKPLTYFDNPLGKFFMQIGMNLVQEFVQSDLLRSQKRKRDRDGARGGSVTQFAINSLLKNLEISKENNEPFHLEQKKCEYCSFKTESSLVMAQHLETPHMRNYVYRCNFCPLEVRSPHDILFHMEAEHNVRGRLERAPAFHQCPNCPFEDNQKGKLTRHLLSCGKKYKPERNQEPPPDWEPPAKIPRVSRSRPTTMGLGAAAYHAMAAKQSQHHPLLPKLVPAPNMTPSTGFGRGRGRPPIHTRYHLPDMKLTQQRGAVPSPVRQGMMYRPAATAAAAAAAAATASPQPQMLLPTTYQIAGNQIYQVVNNQGQMMPTMVPSSLSSVPRLTVMPQNPSASGAAAPTPVALVPNIAAGNNSITIQSANSKNPAAKLLQQPSISITPLPRQPTGMAPGNPANSKHGQHPGGKATFVICEICDGYIKDLEQLRNHMQWIHKVKIHPKMIYNRPPLNCQKCQFRFFTDQGLERHLLGSHGLVTSSMQEAANKGKDGGRCPVCGRVYQWKLLNHVARDHNMTLKPAHLSYKCTVCTATFGMYKQFENHVYSAHSVVAKRVMDKKSPQASRPPQNDALLKPLKINDEITIIPQPAKPRPGPASRTGAIPAWKQEKDPPSKVHSCENCEATFDGSTGFQLYVAHIKRRHLNPCKVKLCRIDECPTCKDKHITPEILEYLEDQKEGVDVIELSDDEMVIGQGRNEITITKVSCAPGPKRFKQRLLQQQRDNVQVIEIEDSPLKNKGPEDGAGRENGEDSLTAVKERLRRRKSLEISQVDSECSSPQSSDDTPAKKRRRVEED